MNCNYVSTAQHFGMTCTFSEFRTGFIFLIALSCSGSCVAYHNHRLITWGYSKTKCCDHDLKSIVESTMCGNVDINWSQYALQGAVAGGCRALSRGLTFPFDTLKTLEQSETPNANTSEIDSNKWKKLLSKEYFRGIIPAVASAVPANAIFFVVYNYLQTIAASDCILHYFSIDDNNFFHDSRVLFIERLIFSAIATLPQNAIKIPAELIKQRAQVQPDVKIGSLIQQAISPPLGIFGLYQGGGAQLIREIPYNAIQMATFQSFKEMFISSDIGLHSGLSVASVSGILGLVAAAIAAILTQPADVIKTRLMTAVDDEQSKLVDGVPTGTRPRDGIVRSTRKILLAEGWKGLFVGLVPRLILVSLGGSVYFWAAEVASEFFEVSLSK